jgi:hypothetical protein
MTARENFLARWSRKKLQADEPKTPAAPKDASDNARGAPSAPPRADTAPGGAASKAPAPQAPFDVASLPSIESITEKADVRAFLQPGVPPELTRAALRRAWVADPAIRDFVGLQEYDWDFNDPAGLLGFGELPPGTDIRKLVARVLGETEEETAERDPAASQPAAEASAIKRGTAASAEPEPAPAAADASAAGAFKSEVPPPEVKVAQVQDNISQRNNNTATHNSVSEPQDEQPKIRRGHGRALPK